MMIFFLFLLLISYGIRTDSIARSHNMMGMVQYPAADKPILHLLNGTLMNNITSCPVEKTKPENIHIVTLASPRYYAVDGSLPFLFYKETLDFYTKSHGYHNHIVDPDTVMKVYGSIKPDSPKGHIIASKSLVMHYKMKEIFHEFGCSAHWVVFLDVDVIMIDLTRTVESVIDAANALMGGPKKSCEFIAQLSSATINTGVLLFRVSPHGERIISSWVDIHKQHANQGRVWQDDQGWIQYVYLKHLEHHHRRAIPIDCAVNLNNVPGLAQANGHRIPTNSIRNNCFAKNLYFYDLWEQLTRRKSAALAKSNKKSGSSSNGSKSKSTENEGAEGNADADGHSSGHHQHTSGTKYCLLRGNSSEDRINMHDWNGDHFISNSTGEYSFVPGTGQYREGGRHVLSECRLHGLWLYHGKNFDFVAKDIKPHWESLKQRFTAIRNGSVAGNSVSVRRDSRFKGYHSMHMFDFPEENSEVCGPVVSKMLLGDALKNDWMAPSMKTIQANFLQEVGYV